MSTRKRGTTNIALSIEELNTLKAGLQSEHGSCDPRDYDYLTHIDKLDARLSKALDRCAKNRGRPDPNWDTADRGIAPDMENE